MGDSDIQRSVRVVSGPTFEPVSLEEAKEWCRIDEDDTSQDATLLMLIIAMREYAEDITGRSFAQRTLELRLRAFPASVIELPNGPVQSVTSIGYLDADGVLQSLDASPSAWQEDIYSTPAVVSPAVGASWPSAQDALGAARIRYVAGYANQNAIPEKLRLWMHTRISRFYENREGVTMQGESMKAERVDFVDGLLDGLMAKRMFA